MDFEGTFQWQSVMAGIPVETALNRKDADVLLVPVYCTGISVFLLLLHSVLSLQPVTGLLKRLGIVLAGTQKPPGIGNGAILRYRIARLLGCLALLALSTIPLAHEIGNALGVPRGSIRDAWMALPYVRRWFALVLAIF
jgi:hypothetical protein